MLISWNNLNIFKWNNTYLHLYEITCKHMYEIEKTKIFIKNRKDTKIPKDIEKNKDICFPFNTLGPIRTFWNITTCKLFFFF
jgi:general stress protein 26